MLSGCFDPSPMMDFIVAHCPRFRQVEQRQSLGACRGESSQALLAKLIPRQPRPKLSKTEPHKPRKMGKFRRICSTPYTLPLCPILESGRAGGRGAHLHFVRRQSKQNYLPASIPSVTGLLQGGREGGWTLQVNVRPGPTCPCRLVSNARVAKNQL